MRPNPSNCQKASRFLVLFLLVTLSSCSHFPGENSSKETKVVDASTLSSGWVKDGLIVISRRAPEVKSGQAGAMLGFVPVKGVHTGTWVSVDRNQNLINVMDGEKIVKSVTGQGADRLAPGLFQLLHKQRNPLWYAPDSYFVKRKLSVPPQEDKSRFRRGALGDFVLFIDKQTPIHSSPVYSDDVGGIRLSEGDISKIYYSLEVGSLIEVK